MVLSLYNLYVIKRSTCTYAEVLVIIEKGSSEFFVLLFFIRLMNKGDEFLKKLWWCAGREYYKIIWLYQPD